MVKGTFEAIGVEVTMQAMEEHLRNLVRLQVALDKTLDEPAGSFARTITRPKLIAELRQAVEGARRAGVTEEDIDQLVAELELTTGKRPIELENFWDPRRMAKGWREKSKLESAVTGTCYEDAWRYLIKEGEGYLIHGSVQLSTEAPRINHAWIELTTGWVWEPQTKSYYTIEDFKIMSPIEEHRYTAEEAAIMVARVGKHGPWADEERSTWLKR